MPHVILLAALFLASIVAPPALAGDTLVTRVCPTDADIDAGVSPPCVIERLRDLRAGVCPAILVDLDAGRIDDLGLVCYGSCAVHGSGDSLGDIMTWPASRIALGPQLVKANDNALKIKAVLTQVVAQSAAGDVDRDTLRSIQRGLDSASTVWNDTRQTVGMVQYVKDQLQDAALDVGVEFLAMQAAVDDLRDWIHANYPTDAGTGADLSYTAGTAGALTALVFSTAQLAVFRTKANAVIALIS